MAESGKTQLGSGDRCGGATLQLLYVPVEGEMNRNFSNFSHVFHIFVVGPKKKIKIAGKPQAISQKKQPLTFAELGVSC